MNSILGQLLLIVCVTVQPLYLWGADPNSEEKFKIGLIRGFDVASTLPESDYQESVKSLFRGEDVQFYLKEGGYTKNELLSLMKSLNVFYINTHSGDSETLETQVIKVKPTPGSGMEEDYLVPDEIRKAVGTDGGPKLVIINGCSTTAYHLANAQRIDRRLATGFGIGPNAKGRAYLGWQSMVVAKEADKYFANQLLKAWTTPGSNHEYPTLSQAKETAGRYSVVNQLNIVGDASLRYDFLRGYIRNLPIRGVWKFEEPDDPQKKKEQAGWLNMRFVLKGNGRIHAYSTVDPSLERVEGISYWRLDGDYKAPLLTLIQCDQTGKRQRVFSSPLVINIETPNRVGLTTEDDIWWFTRDRNTR